MSKVGIAVMLAVLFCHGAAFGQSLLDSVFGSSGLGVLGAPQGSPSFDDPRYYSGNVNADPNQQVGQPTQPGYPQGYDPQYPPQTYGYGQSQNAPQQPYYPQAPSQPTAQESVPRYGAAPAPPAPQASPSVRPSPRSSGQSQRQRTARQRPATSPQETTGKFGDPLPPGAVRITTTTPEGITVQYYPPAEAPENEQAYSQRPRPRAAASRAPRSEQQATQVRPESVGSSIAMPKPVPIPQGQDPRMGWTPNR